MRKVDGFVLLSAGDSRTFPWKAHVWYTTPNKFKERYYTKKIEDSSIRILKSHLYIRNLREFDTSWYKYFKKTYW